MTENELIEVLKNNYPKTCKMVNGRYQGGFDDTECDFGQALTSAISALKEIQQYREIGTVEECREAVEKQKPKKCVIDSCPDHTHYKCSSCGKIHLSRYKHGCPDLGRIPRFCEYCGQAIDENLEGMEDEW